MPYIKYRGVWCGSICDSIREQVSYEDPGAPCYEGHAKLLAEARRIAEDAHSDPTAIAHATKAYVSDHPYPGLLRVGGVGFVEERLVHPICEEISSAEYQQLRSEIETSNAEYQTKKVDTLSKNNDPLRRASSEHEKLGWRTRVWVTSYTELKHHMAYPLGERSVAYLRMRLDEPSGSGLTAQLMDIYHSSNGDVQQALLEGTDLAEMLADLLALAGYGAARVLEVLGTTVPYCSIGEVFPLATFGALIRNTPIPVRPSDLAGANLETGALLVLRHLRDGLSAALPTTSFAAFWNALERQADEEARAKNLQRMVKCTKCGDERTAGPDLKRGFEAMYTQAGLDPSLFNRHRSLRGTIQHGAKLPSAGYVDGVLQDLPQLQRAAMIAVARKLGIVPGTILSLSTCWPVGIYSCHAKHDGTFVIQDRRFGVKASANILPQRISGEAPREIFMGMPSQPKIDPLSFPPVQC